MVNLFPTERRIVELLLAIPGYELGSMTSSDLSEKSGASRSSIDRLSRKLGYQGLKDMRKSLLFEQAERDGPAAPGVRRSSTTEDIARRVMAALVARAEMMVRLVAQNSAFDTFIEWLASARTIHLIGAGESAVVCEAFQLRLVRLGLPILFTPEYHTQVTRASLLGPLDIAVAISHSGATKSTVRAATVAKQTGARLAVIGGITNSPLSRKADLFIQLPTGNLPGSAEVLDRVVAIGLAQVAFECLAARHPEMRSISVRIDDAFNEDRM
ncbi:MAG: MurR/RpiR family transcriptional regulator [Ancalomicrobiaceae bacterium]|nr:MurR/RpiR family transcriptional regulator [Ancalomicrobiaceae bacterium]